MTKNFLLTLLQLQGKFSVFQGDLTQIQFNIQNVYAYVEILPTIVINPTINPPDLWYILYDIIKIK